MARTSDTYRVNRRSFMKASAATGAALAAGSVFASAAHAARTFKIGYVSPQTGPLAAFAEADNFVISNFLNTVKGGVKVGSAMLPVEVVVKDSQSNPNRAAEVAKELIVPNKIDLMLVASTPETTNPVATMWSKLSFVATSQSRGTSAAGMPPRPSSLRGSGASRVHRTTPSGSGSPELRTIIGCMPARRAWRAWRRIRR